MEDSQKSPVTDFPRGHRTGIPAGWLIGLAALLGIGLCGFWNLLNYQFSPESYQVVRSGMGMVEIFWFSVAVVATVLALASVWREEERVRQWVYATCPLAIVAVFILGLNASGMAMRYYVLLLFAVASGWSGYGVLRKAQHWPQIFSMEKCWAWGLVAVTVGLGFYFFKQQRWYLNHLALGYQDLGETMRTVYNSIHNSRELFLRVNPEKPLFYDHFQPGMLPFLPFGLWVSGVELVIGFQVFATLICVWPIYWIGKRILQDPVAARLLVTLWLIHPSTSQLIYNASYGFRWGNLCLPLYFFALAFWLGGRPMLALAAMAWALLLKEEAAIVLIMFGLYLALFERQRKQGFLLAVAAIGYFELVSSVLIPYFSGGGYLPGGYFRDLGETKGEILVSPFTKSQVFWGRLFEPATFCFAGTLLAPVLFLPLKKPKILFIGSLTFLFIGLWYNPMPKSICHQYQAGLLPVLFLAVVRVLQEDVLDSLRRRALLSGVFISTLVLSLFLGNTFWSKDSHLRNVFPGRLALVQRMQAQIDPSATLVAAQRSASHFISQKYLYVPFFYYSFELPVPLDYVLLDLREDIYPVDNRDWLRSIRILQKRVETREDLHLVDAEDGMLLYARKGQPFDRCALVERDSLPQDILPWHKDLGNGLQVVGCTLAPLAPLVDDKLDRVRVRAYCTTRESGRKQDVAVQCLLQLTGSHSGENDGDTYASEYQPLGQGLWPIERWRVGKYYVEEFTLLLPQGLQREKCAMDFKVEMLSEGSGAATQP